MDRFKSLAGVIFGADGQAPSFIEELALIIGLAADRVKTEVEQSQHTQQRRNWQVALGFILLIVLVVGGGIFWAQQQGLQNIVPWFLIAGVVLLGLALLLVAPTFRPQDSSATPDSASVTRLGRFYWPVGILPLSSKRAVLWDPLTENDLPLHVMELPADFGAQEEGQVSNAEHVSEAFDVLLAFSEGLEGMEPIALPWPGNAPDESAQKLGQDLSQLWQQMIPVTLDEVQPAVPASATEEVSDWEQMEGASAYLYHFYTTIDRLRESVAEYRQRAATLVDAAREVLIDRHWHILQQVEQDRERHFSRAKTLPAFGDRALPTSPQGKLSLTPADSMEQVLASLNNLDAALAPLDKVLEGAIQQLEQKEARALAQSDQEFALRRKELDDDKRRLEALDSDILRLGTLLDEHQQKIGHYATQAQHGFKEIEGVPLPAVKAQLLSLEESIHKATILVDDVNQKIELEAVEQTLARLRAVTEAAEQQWQALATTMPERSGEVRERVDRVLTQLSALAERPEVEESALLQQIQTSVKDVERVARVVVSWAAAQEDPITPVEDKERELADHLAALREQRRKLEDANEILDFLIVEAEESVTLRTGLTQAEQTLLSFQRLAEQSSTTITAMDNAAAAVKQQAEQLQALLRERDKVRARYSEALSALQEEEQAARLEIQQNWQTQRESLLAQRESLKPLPESVQARVARLRERPALERMGLLQDEDTAPWPDVIVNQMGHGIDLWGQRVAGLDYAEGTTLIDQLREKLEACYANIDARAVPVNLEGEGALQPQLCFVPFWLVETEDRPGDPESPGKRLHLFPPMRIAPRKPTDQPQIEALLYPELSRRLTTFLRQDFSREDVSLNALSFDPVALSERARRLDIDAAAPALQTLAIAFSHHLVFFRTTDEALKRVIQNSLNTLIPETQLHEAWTQSVQQQASLSDQQRRLAEVAAQESGRVEEELEGEIIEGEGVRVDKTRRS